MSVGSQIYAEPMNELTEDQQAMLTFERQWWKHAGAKEAAILDTFDVSTVRYYQTLNALLDEPAAMEFDPMTVKRLRRLRDARRAQRTSRSPS